MSHSGGEPGFLVGQGNQLSLKGFSGNNLFNTLDSINRATTCGIALLDIERGELVQLTAHGTIIAQGKKRVIALDVSNTKH